MAEKLENLQITWRPHFKTHQSAEIGDWYRDYGVNAITVSSPDMATYFAKNDWGNITIAFPATPLITPRINSLAQNLNSLRICINDPVTAQHLTKYLSESVEFYIEIDAGFGRTGLKAEYLDKLNEIISIAQKSQYLHFYGFYLHDGRTYQVQGQENVRDIMTPVFEKLSRLSDEFKEASICIGDTPSSSLLNSFPGIDELSPGNNVFFDLMQVAIGSCRPEDIAVAVQCPVAEVKRKSGACVLHGGAVHFSKERIDWSGKEIYGMASRPVKNGFGNLQQGNYLKSLSQEHGWMVLEEPGTLDNIKPGDRMTVFPVHSCLTANLFSHYITPDGKRIEKRILS